MLMSAASQSDLVLATLAAKLEGDGRILHAANQHEDLEGLGFRG